MKPELTKQQIAELFLLLTLIPDNTLTLILLSPENNLDTKIIAAEEIFYRSRN